MLGVLAGVLGALDVEKDGVVSVQFPQVLFRLQNDVAQWAKDLQHGAAQRLGKKELDIVTTGLGSAIARSVRYGGNR